MKLWEKGEKKTLGTVEKFEVGKDYIYDREIAKYDVRGTIAHLKMLNKIGILSDDETRKLTLELEYLEKKFEKEPPNLKVEDEDIHTYIENYLTSTLGDIGKKVHTGRSRNDQVLTAIRLYEKDKISEILGIIDRILRKLIDLSKKYRNKPFIGYTHLRQAMPTTVDTWLNSFIEALEDDRKLLRFVHEFIDKNPLGSSAGYGFPIKLDREFTTKLLGFSSYIENPIYAQNTRGKYESLLIFALTTLLGDIARFSNDIIIFSSDEFEFVKLKDEITTGSSIMPHKKNPDIFELMRAKCKKLIGYLTATMDITFSLPSGYNKDLQETKETTIESINETINTLLTLESILDYIEIDEEKIFSKMSKKIFSVDIAVMIMEEFKIPFRDAYRLVGETLENPIPDKNPMKQKILELLSLDVKELFKLAMEKRK